jgi:trehalose 6-phosphate phosphatase
MSQNAVTRIAGGWALFLDVDGTIVEIADTPQDVQVPDGLKELLDSLCVRFHGALALVSGRTLADLDRMFAPFRFCAAGVHGCERRDPSGFQVYPDVHPRVLDRARHALLKLVEGQADLLLEDKAFGLALHYRRAPQLRMFAGTIVKSVLSTLGPAFTLQQGHCVYEIRPSTSNKATAIAAFMAQAPFCGRRPMFVGDDLTDEDAFEYVNAHGGMSIKVGTHSPSAAKYTVGRVADALEWLKGIPPVRPPDGAALTFRIGG